MILREGLCPAGCGLGGLEVEAAGVEELGEWQLSVLRTQDLGRGVEVRDEGLDPLERGFIHEVGLVDDDDGRELDLLGHEGGHGAAVLVVLRPATLDDVVLTPHLLQQARCVHHGDHGVHGDPVGYGGQVVQVQGQRLGHRERLRDASGLDHEGVVAPVIGEPADLLEQVLPERAADATVGELHQALLALEDLDPSVPGGEQELAVEAPLAHLVHEHRDATAVSVREEVS